MYGQMTAGSWIYIGDPGHPPGHVRDVRRAGRQHFGGSLRGRVVLTAGLGGMGGAQPLAVTMNEGVALVHRGRSRARPTAAGDRLRRPPDRLARRGAGLGARAPPRTARRYRSRWSATPPSSSPSSSVAASGSTSSPTRRRAHDALDGYVPAGLSLAEAADLRDDRSRRLRPTLDGLDGRPRAGDARVPAGRRRRPSTTATTSGPRPRTAGVAERLRLPGLRAGLHPAALLRGQGPVPLGCAVGRSGRHPAHRPGRSWSSSPRTRRCAAGSRWPRSGSPFQGLPARICWLGYGERAKAGLEFNDWSPAAN